MDAEFRQRYEQLDDFFENGAVGLHIVAADGTILRANKAELKLLGYTAEEYIGRHIQEVHVDREVIDAILARLTSGEEVEKHSARLRAKDGSVKHVLITSSGQFRDGKLVNTRCFTIDITETKHAEELRQQREHEYRQILDALPAAVYTTDAAGRITYYNEAACELAGRRPNIGDEWCVTWRLYRPDGTYLPHEQCPMAVALKEDRAVRGEEAIAERPDGTRVPFIPYPTPLRDASGKLVGAINMLVDITERKRADEMQQLLIEELNHRVKNTLATVQALAQQTQRRSRSPEHFLSSFNGRIQALARAHNLLSVATWKGAGLAELVKDQLLLATGGETQVQWSGPAVTLAPQAAMHMALVLHELATNARKYGALATPEGRLAVKWSLVSNGSRMLQLRWEETGCKEVQSPSKPGFGTFFIEQIVKPDGGEARMTQGANGLTWDITLMLTASAYVRPPAEQHSRPVVLRSAELSLKGKRELVVEDEPLIALELAQTLTDADLEVVTIARTIAEAHRAIAEHAIDAALVDGNLAGEKVDSVAASLARKGVPFVFMTGYGRDSLPAEFRNAGIVHKPFTASQTLEAVSELFSGRGPGVVVPLRRPEASSV